jgi:Cof subfamily protein (haloacid dehalogenase superfamily)
MRLVATDLDGTLLRGDRTVSARTVATLRRLARRGVSHVVVTGRPAVRCAPFFAALDYRGLAICGHGTQLYDAGNRRLLASTELNPASARSVLGRIADRIGPLDLAVDTAGPAGEFLVGDGFGRGDEADLAPFRRVTGDRLWDLPIEKVVLRHPTVPDADLVAIATGCCLPDVVVTLAGPGFVELLPARCDKAGRLAQVAAALGVPSHEAVAFGDMPSDRAMLAWAGWAVAMANGHPELKATADEIAPDHDEDGVAVVLDRILAAGGLVPTTGTR